MDTEPPIWGHFHSPTTAPFYLFIYFFLHPFNKGLRHGEFWYLQLLDPPCPPPPDTEDDCALAFSNPSQPSDGQVPGWFLWHLKKILCLFLAPLGLRCCSGFFLVFIWKLLIAMTSLVAELGLQSSWASVNCSSWAPEHRLNSCGSRPYLRSSTWDLPRPGIEPVSPALAGGFFSKEPPGKPCGI